MPKVFWHFQAQNGEKMQTNIFPFRTKEQCCGLGSGRIPTFLGPQPEVLSAALDLDPDLVALNIDSCPVKSLTKTCFKLFSNHVLLKNK
jgi:hypothetical protein